MTTLDQLTECLTSVERTAPGAESPRSTWTASTLGLRGGHVFGGQMIGQTVVLGARLHPDKAVKSVSVVFPRGARDTGSLEYTADALHAGSAYATTRVDLAQPGRDGLPVVGFSAHLMHHATAEGVEHHRPMPEAGDPDDARPVELGLVPWETRIVGTTDLDDRRAQPAELTMWMRADDGLPDDAALHQALLAFASELTLIGTALLPHDGWSQLDAHVTMRTSVLAHHVQFHRPFRLDDWLLVSQRSDVASGGSAFGSGHVFTADGDLVASFQQESMTRVAASS
jgi:acyl-CoA thioesterase-2